MAMQVSPIKITVPSRRKEWLSRRRLLDLLDTMVDMKLTLVVAPPGYGKTSLLVDFACQAGMPVCWLALDALDQDPRRFLVSFIAAISNVYPEFGRETLASVLSDPASGPDMGLLTTVLVNEVESFIGEHFIIILDDLQFVNDSQEIIEFINAFILEVGENCHLILSSRTLPSLPDLPAMAARMNVSGISFEELAFSADEIQALILQNSQILITRAEAEELVEESEGWVTGLILTTHTVGKGGADLLRLARVSGVGLYEYLAQQVLEGQPPEIREFLLQSSFLGEFDAELCRDVFGQDVDWLSQIDKVLQSNLFILAIGERGNWYRYNPLFQSFLQESLTRDRPDEAVRILRRLADVYTEREDWEKAYLVVQQLGDMEEIANLILKASPSLARNGRLITLATWLDELPPEHLHRTEELLSLRGVVGVMLGDLEFGLAMLDDAIRRFRSLEDHAGLALSLTRRTFAYMFRGDYQASLADAQEAYELCRDVDGLRAVRADALRSQGISLIRLDRNIEAQECLHFALDLYRELGDLNKMALTRLDLGFASSVIGRYQHALTYYEHSLRHWEQIGNLVHKATVLNNMGVIFHAQGEYIQASNHFEEALLAARRTGYHQAESLTLASIGDIYSDLEDYEAAANAYRQAKSVAIQGNYQSLLHYLDLAEAQIAFLKGDLIEAQELLSLAKRRFPGMVADYEAGLYNFRAGQLALLKEDPQQAIEDFSLAAEQFTRGGRQSELSQVYLLLAESFCRLHDLKQANWYLERSVATATPISGGHFLAVIGRQTRQVLTHFSKDEAVQTEFAGLFERVRQFDHEIPALRRRLRQQKTIVPISPPPLVIRAFGQGIVEVAGRRLTRSEWKSFAARDMFFCLLAHSDGLSKEVLGAMFWPEVSAKQMRINFKNTLYRLRLALGPEAVQFDLDRYCFNTALDYNYDVKDFLERVKLAKSTDDPRDRALAYQHALRLYEGDYLIDVDRSWVAFERERLRREFFSAGLALGDLLLEMGEYENALDPGLHIVKMDPSYEAAHRLLMRAHALMGNRAAVIRQYNRCNQTLRREYDTTPSPQTEELFRQLTR